MDLGESRALADMQLVGRFGETGYHVFSERVHEASAASLLWNIKATRAFDAGLFLTEAEFDTDPHYRGVNPKPGRNLLERFACQLGFVERAPQIVSGIGALLGPDYTILDRKVVCGVPERSVPAWLRSRIAGNPVNNLGPYVRPEYRDVTYFYGIDFHQDLIDYPARKADFLTLYVYLHTVTAQDAPLFLLEGSHALGASVFPHDLAGLANDARVYRTGAVGQAACRQIMLTGGAGQVAMWHACTLHGAQPDAADHERISLRYLFARGSAAHTGMDAVNAGLRGPVSLDATRADLDAQGAAAIRVNIVNEG